MDDLLKIQTMLNESSQMISSKNFYFENHLCDVVGQTIKVAFDFTVKEYKNEKIINFGQCPHCKKLNYHEDYDSDSR